MRWKGRRTSTNVEDRRRMSPKKAGGRLGLGALVIIILVWLFGGNPMELIQLLDTSSQGTIETTTTTAHEDELAEFVAVITPISTLIPDCTAIFSRCCSDALPIPCFSKPGLR